ncbi:MAG: DEAD/DEAH box helicase family protein [Bdellovibrionales bacterium]|nr:DEAD/DEAH box helicase family protein [Bdellovibrionales bacterium]
MNRIVQSITNRLSLREPQRESLELLAEINTLVNPHKDQDTMAVLAAIQTHYPKVEDFERDFPSLCFALATGVGKTRLMGAFIAYLHQAKGTRHFFVLAPNLTIYNKLIADFTPNTPKYVFQGITEFALNPPEIITGDNYEGGRGVRAEDRAAGLAAQPLPGMDTIHINIFNISKINTEVRGGASPRIKRLAEYIGESYFDYLAALPDLVLIMDEAHRYRAAAGMRAINELKPILGLELTATPFTEGSGGVRTPFKNVIYEYALSNAMRDGFVKEPAVATRENFRASDYSAAQLEKLKLEDGIRVHENTKVELATYAKQHGVHQVKPFMLVVAQDTAHAEDLMDTIKSDGFFEGRYKDRVITVHSNQRGEESEATVAKLLAVEDPDEPTEIVIHVNMLKEGWDVRNLYTIVPLRTANSRTLVEQSIGRGLRLPYGKRTRNEAVDTLTIVAHDRFQEIIDHAKDQDSVIRKGLIIGKDIPDTPQKVMLVPSAAESRLIGTPVQSQDGANQIELFPTVEKPLYTTEAEQSVVKATLNLLPAYERLQCSADLTKPEVMAQLSKDVEAHYTALPQAEGEPAPDVPAIVQKVVEVVSQGTIDIPKVVLVPKGEVSTGFNDFDLDASSIRFQPVDQPILVEAMRTNDRRYLEAGLALSREKRPEDYLVRELMNRDDISYDDHAALLYKLAGQMVAHLSSYLGEPEDVVNVLQAHQKQLGDFIYAAMSAHTWEKVDGFEAQVTRGFKTLQAQPFQIPADEGIRNFRDPVTNKQDIPRMVFGEFKRCLYPVQKFSSDPERVLAVILENERKDLKWVKPARGQFQIHYRFEREDHQYEPDFVVETETTKYLVEPKRDDQMKDEQVLAKAGAARAWCEAASAHATKNEGKSWKYVLVPHTAIQPNMTLDGLIGAHG